MENKKQAFITEDNVDIHIGEETFYDISKKENKKKAIIVEYNFMTRIVIDEKDENIDFIVEATKQKILDKVNNELSENFSEWYDDTECPYNEEVD